MILYHYTSADALKSIIESSELWTTQIQYLNDESEFRHAVDVGLKIVHSLRAPSKNLDPEMLDAIQDRIETMNGARTFVFSLSEQSDQLSQWRGYCPHGGYSIGFDSESLSKSAEPQGFRLVKCIYDQDAHEKIVSRVISRAIAQYQSIASSGPIDDPSLVVHQSGLYGALMKAGTIIKNPSFSEEMEWRLIGGPFPFHHTHAGWRPRDHLLIPYHVFRLPDYTIRHIVVGPSTLQNQAYESLGWYLRNKKLVGAVGPDLSIRTAKSAVPYRST